MLPNIDRNLYARFKREGYRKREYATTPVRSFDEVVQLGYLHVCRTIRHIQPRQAEAFKKAVVSNIGAAGVPTRHPGSF